VEGEPVFVEETTLGNSLAHVLVRQEVISQEQYSTVVERMTDVLVDNEDIAFCDIAVELEYLSPEQVTNAFYQRIRSKIIEVIGWKKCRISIDEYLDDEDSQESFPVNLGPLLYAGIRAFYDEKRIRASMNENAEHFVRLREPAASIVEHFGLDDDEAEFLGSCDGNTSVSLLLERGVLYPLHAWQVLCLLKLSESAEFVEISVAEEEKREAERESQERARAAEPKAGEPEKDANDPERIAAARREAVRRAAVKMDRRSAPNKKPDPRTRGKRATPKKSTAGRSPKKSRKKPFAVERLGHELRGRATEPAMRVAENARRASGPSPIEELRKRKRMSEVNVEEPDADEARAACERGLLHLRSQFFPRARDEFRKACAIDPEQEVYRMYLLWTEEKTTKFGLQDEHRRELKELAKSHLLVDQHSAFAYYILGHLALTEQNERGALKYFKKAANQDPKNQDAVRHVRILSSRRGKR
jgi:hypothetical protein